MTRYIALAAVAVGVGGYLLFVMQTEPTDPHEYIRNGILSCLDERRPLWHGPCLRELADGIRERMEADEALRTLASLDDEQPIKSVCHALVHYIGQDLYAETGDSSKAFAQCARTIACGEGCIHGVVEGYLQDPSRTPETSALASLCDRAEMRNDMDYRACNHGIGHALMLVTEGDIERSLASCDMLELPMRDQCHSGVFMENVFGHWYLDDPRAYVDIRDPHYPCTTMREEYRERCFASQASFVMQNDPARMEAGARFCASIDEPYRVECYGSLGGESVVSTEDPEAVVRACDLVPPGGARDRCVYQALYFRIQMTDGDAPALGAICSSLAVSEREECVRSAGRVIALWYGEESGPACNAAFSETRERDACGAAARL